MDIWKVSIYNPCFSRACKWLESLWDDKKVESYFTYSKEPPDLEQKTWFNYILPTNFYYEIMNLGLLAAQIV